LDHPQPIKIKVSISICPTPLIQVIMGKLHGNGMGAIRDARDVPLHGTRTVRLAP
jgi:hypothetical protein